MLNNRVQFNDISDFGFYKPSITKIGIQSVLIFDANGLPIFFRSYDSKVETDRYGDDVLITTAFISSMISYISSYTKELFTDFGIGQSRYYLKLNKDKIFCLTLNEIINKRTTGESMRSLMELTINQLIKAVNKYYEMADKKIFMELNDLENFVLHIDTVLFYNFKKAAMEMEASSTYKKPEFDNFKIRYSNSDQYGPLNHQLLIKGIQGLMIFGENNQPLIVRDYALERNYETNVEYYSGISVAIKKFAETNFGALTDFGFGKTRVLVKVKEQDFMICLFISELLFWRITGEILTMFMELSLKDIVRSFETYLSLFSYKEKKELDTESKSVLNEQMDLLLLENAKMALKELNY